MEAKELTEDGSIKELEEPGITEESWAVGVVRDGVEESLKPGIKMNNNLENRF